MAEYVDPNEVHVTGIALTSAPKQDGGERARYVSNDAFFRAAGEIATEEVFIPLLDGTMLIKALTAHDVQRAREDTTETKGGRTVPRTDRDFATMVFFYAAINPDGSPFFRRNQIEQLHTVNYAAIQPGTRAALRLSGLDDEAAEMERKKAFEGARDDA